MRIETRRQLNSGVNASSPCVYIKRRTECETAIELAIAAHGADPHPVTQRQIDPECHARGFRLETGERARTAAGFAPFAVEPELCAPAGGGC